jgi:hypothetical protein
LTFPVEFSFESGHQDGRFLEIFNIIIRPCMLPAEFNGGRLNHSTYEYYKPNVMARQLGCGKMPQGYFCMNSSSPGRKSKNLCTAVEFSIMCAVLLFTPGLLCLPQ